MKNGRWVAYHLNEPPIDGEIGEYGSQNNPRSIDGSHDRCSRTDREGGERMRGVIRLRL